MKLCPKNSHRPWLLLLAGLIFAFPVIVQAGEVNKGAIVLLLPKDAKGESTSSGTGFIVDPYGTLVTNYHVLLDATSIDAVFRDGSVVPVKSIRKIDRKRDFAILQLEKGIYSTLELGDSTNLKAFDYSSALGYLTDRVRMENGAPQGTLLQTYGFILGVHRQAHPDFDYIYTTARFGPGFSGGPVVNKNNQVIGLATVEGRSLNLALPTHYFRPFIKSDEQITFEQLAREDRTAREALYYRGNFALYGEGNPDAAIEQLKKAIADDPDYVLAHYDLAAAYRDSGMMEKALEEYKKVIELNPRFPEALSNLGGLSFRQGQVDQAITYFQHAVEHFPNFVQALSNLGAALNKKNRSAEAVAPLKKAVAIDPEFGMAYFNLGNAQFAMKDYSGAQASFGSAVQYGIDFLSLHWKLHEIFEKQGDRARAKNELDLILQIDPENPEAQKKIQAYTVSPK